MVNHRALMSFKKRQDDLVFEAIRHWFETHDLKYREYIEMIFIDHDREIRKTSYEGNRLGSVYGLTIWVFYSNDLPKETTKRYANSIEPFGYTETRDLTAFLSNMFDFEDYEIEAVPVGCFLDPKNATRYYGPTINDCSGHLIRLNP